MRIDDIPEYIDMVQHYYNIHVLDEGIKGEFNDLFDYACAIDDLEEGISGIVCTFYSCDSGDSEETETDFGKNGTVTALVILAGSSSDAATPGAVPFIALRNSGVGFLRTT